MQISLPRFAKPPTSMSTAPRKSTAKSSSPPGAAAKDLDLEKSLAELEAIVEQLESGELSLDKSLKEFERGVRLSRACQGALKNAEQRVQVLLGDQLGNELQDFETGEMQSDVDPAAGDDPAD